MTPEEHKAMFQIKNEELATHVIKEVEDYLNSSLSSPNREGNIVYHLHSISYCLNDDVKNTISSYFKDKGWHCKIKGNSIDYPFCLILRYTPFPEDIPVPKGPEVHIFDYGGPIEKTLTRIGKFLGNLVGKM